MNFLKKYGNHHKDTLFLGIPIVVGQLGQIVLGWTDNIMIGQYDAQSLAAASFVNNLMNIPILFGLGFAYGLTPIVAQLFAKKDYYGMGNYLKNSFLANLSISLILMLGMSLFLLNIRQLGQPEELLPLIRPYFVIQLVSVLFVMAFNSFKQFFDGITHTRLSMWIMLGCNAVNILCNYVLIYGHWGFPEMGLMGAGLSTLFSRVLMLVLAVGLFYGMASYKRYRVGFRKSSLNQKSVKRLGKMGFFIGLQMGMENGAFSLSTIMMGWIGSAALAAHQIVCTVTTIGFMVYYGIGAAVSIRVSNFAAKNNWTDVKHASSAGFHIILCFVLIVSTILLLIKNSIGYLFVKDIEIVSLTAQLMIPVLLFQFGDGLQVCYANILRGLHDVKAMAVLSFVGYFLLALPASYIFGFVLNWGAVGIWFGFPIGLTATGILFFLRYRWLCRKN